MVLRAIEGVGKSVLSSIIEAFELSDKSFEIKRQEKKLSGRATDKVAKLVKTYAAEDTTREMVEAVKSKITDLKGQLSDVKLAIEKLASETSQMKVSFVIQTMPVKKYFSAKKAFVKCLERVCAVMAKKRLQSVAKGLLKGYEASRHSPNDEELFQD